MKKFNTVVIGGTFDNLHNGHIFFIKSAFEKSHKVIIGLTSDNFVQNKTPSPIAPFEDRKSALINFLKTENLFTQAEIIPIENIYGITLEEKNIDAIFVTEDNIKNAERINEERIKINFPPLEIIKVEMLKNEAGEIISSSNIRLGLTNDFGIHYADFFGKAESFTLLEKYREEFKKPLGYIVKEFAPFELKDKFIIAVGDIVVYNLVKKGIIPNISIYDHINSRTKIPNDVLASLPAMNVALNNKPGTINSRTALGIQKTITKAFKENIKLAIKIFGEEDLLVIPSVLFAPLNSLVIYGQKNIGAIVVDVTLAKKEDIENNYLTKFTPYNE